MAERIYLDSNSTTPLLPEVLESMRPFWAEQFGNASSTHRHGQQAHAAVERARSSIAALIGADPAEIVFTSGGTESNNLALSGIMFQHLGGSPRVSVQDAARPHLVTSAIEHHAVLLAAEALRDFGIDVTVLPCTASGRIEPAALAAALTQRTRLVSIMLANNETGVVQPIAELARVAHAAGALFHTDAVQVPGKLPLNVRALGVDLLTLSAHKLHGPKGVGALYVRRGLALRPLQFGGPHERQRRAGTENVPGIVGFGRAAELASSYLSSNKSEAAAGPAVLALLRDQLEHELLSTIPHTGVNGAGEPRLPNTLNLYFDGVDAEALLIALDLQGLAVSAGSACQSGATAPSHVLRAMCLSDVRAHASIRFSLSRFNTVEEITRAAGILRDTVSRLRAVAPASREHRREPLLAAQR